ncbi:macrolide family glycosyltransferase [Kribbella kalugense]|uniref:MGT family glycosyltransferase n=1 Tax=Kribbella kalugense TaxID=2512221 RepID=A0A4R7ZX56_9ACTN|nr:macrolide family glycosyltransferase [Kribbella kalugense]TDW22355.1 MGT family glycosyltransferase [Kribbella kalugense]
MGAHIAFLTIPAAGHLNPTLPLVAELVRRGHRVSYATGAAFRSAVLATGAEFVELDWAPQAVKVSPAGQTTAELGEMLTGFVRIARRVIPAIEQWLETDRPDLFCYDMMTFIGPMVAAKLGLLEATTVANLATNEHFDFRREMAPADFDPRHPKFQQFMTERAAFAADFGVPVEKVVATGAVAGLNLVFVPREFQVAGETFDERFRFVGPAVGARVETADWEPPADGRPLLFVSLGTVVNDRPDFFTACAKAFGGTNWHVAMAIGDQVDPAVLGAAPANFDVRRSFPQPAVLAHAAAFLTHAGMNSVMEALLYQVPMATFPQTPEQHANARRVAELGLGRSLPDLDPESLREVVDGVAADPSIVEQLEVMAGHLHRAGGPVAAADAVEAYLATPGAGRGGGTRGG